MKDKFRILKISIILLVCFFILIPFVWMFLISFRNKADVFNLDVLFPKLVLSNYLTIFGNKALLKFFLNSIIVAVFSTLFSIIIGGFAAYGFARFEWKKKESQAFFALSQKFLPAMAVVIPYFLMAVFFRLLDTKLLLIIAYTSFNIPFTIWMMRSFIEDLPIALEEAAFIDGCTRIQAIQKIVFPIVLPGLVATAIFCIITSWNEFAFANFLTSVNSRTVPTSVVLYLSVSGVKWGEIAATGVLAEIPILVFAILVQKHMVRGLTFGAVKS